MLDWRHVFDDRACLAGKICTVPACLFGAAEGDEFFVDDLKVAHVTRVPRAARLIGPVQEGFLAAIGVGVGARKLVVLCLGKGLEPSPVVVLE